MWRAISRPAAAESVTAHGALMRGSVEEIVARIDAEADAFKARLALPEAQKALATFLTRQALRLSGRRVRRD